MNTNLYAIGPNDKTKIAAERPFEMDEEKSDAKPFTFGGAGAGHLPPKGFEFEVPVPKDQRKETSLLYRTDPPSPPPPIPEIFRMGNKLGTGERQDGGSGKVRPPLLSFT